MSYNVEPNYITDGNDGYLFYYYNNFLLISEYTKNLLQKYEKKNNFVYSSVYLGDNHIFLVFRYHYHLDRYCVSNGQNVNANTIIGYTEQLVE